VGQVVIIQVRIPVSLAAMGSVITCSMLVLEKTYSNLILNF